jgi:LDH2 family malate/lactate/ureidoglycolate dehydrogenase
MEASNDCSGSIVEIERGMIQKLITKLLQRKGMFAAEAEIVAERMIEADLDRRAEEGAGTLPQYLEAMDLGDIDPRARMITVSETPSIAVVDGSSGIGHVAATRAMQIAIEKGREIGTGTVVVKNSRPGGDLGGIARLAASAGLIGVVTTSFEDQSETPAAHDLAWSLPGPVGLQPIIQRESRKSLGSTAVILCGILSAGLAGADLIRRKKKGLRAANLVEYCLVAIEPGLFGSRDALLEKWRPLWSGAGDVSTEPQTSQTIPYSKTVAKLLAELATKIKLPPTW